MSLMAIQTAFAFAEAAPAVGQAGDGGFLGAAAGFQGAHFGFEVSQEIFCSTTLSTGGPAPFKQSGAGAIRDILSLVQGTDFEDGAQAMSAVIGLAIRARTRRSFPARLRPLLVAGAVLIGVGCQRTALLSRSGEAASGGANGSGGGSDAGTAADSSEAASGGGNGRPDAGTAAESSRGLKLVAGGLGGKGSVDGFATAARFDDPSSIASDGAGNLFVMDNFNRTIRKVVIATGEVTTLAGSFGGSGDKPTEFDFSSGIVSDRAGNLFVVDTCNRTIRKVVIATGEVTTLAGSPGQWGNTDGTGAAARFEWPYGMVGDGAGHLFVADAFTIRKVVIATGEVTTLAGSPGQAGHADGIGDAARFENPSDMASDGAGNLFVADSFTIRKVAIATGEVTTFTGSPGQTGNTDGTGTAARFDWLDGMASDGAGNLFVAENYGYTIRKVAMATGEVTTLAGSPEYSGSSDGTGAAARFDHPHGIASDGTGNLFVVDTGNNAIRKVVIATGGVTTFAGLPEHQGSSDGTGAAARFYGPRGIASDGAGNLFVADLVNCTIRKVIIATGEVTTLAGSPGQAGSSDGIGAAARFDYPGSIASDGAGNLFVTDINTTIRKIVIATGEVTTLAGLSGQYGSSDGAGAAARFELLDAIASDGAGNLFVADSFIIRKVVIATGEVSTLAGSPEESGGRDGTGATARFNGPSGITIDGAGNLFVADGFTIRRVVIATGEVTTFAGSPKEWGSSDGTGTAARFAYLQGIASDGAGNLFVADYNHTIRKIVVRTQTVTTVVGSPDRVGVVLGPLPAGLSEPWGLALGPAGELLISDSTENAILALRF
jgi:hypothetical protein